MIQWADGCIASSAMLLGLDCVAEVLSTFFSGVGCGEQALQSLQNASRKSLLQSHGYPNAVRFRLLHNRTQKHKVDFSGAVIAAVQRVEKRARANPDASRGCIRCSPKDYPTTQQSDCV